MWKAPRLFLITILSSSLSWSVNGETGSLRPPHEAFLSEMEALAIMEGGDNVKRSLETTTLANNDGPTQQLMIELLHEYSDNAYRVVDIDTQTIVAEGKSSAVMDLDEGTYYFEFLKINGQEIAGPQVMPCLLSVDWGTIYDYQDGVAVDMLLFEIKATGQVSSWVHNLTNHNVHYRPPPPGGLRAYQPHTADNGSQDDDNLPVLAFALIPLLLGGALVVVWWCRRRQRRSQQQPHESSSSFGKRFQDDETRPEHQVVNYQQTDHDAPHELTSYPSVPPVSPPAPFRDDNDGNVYLSNDPQAITQPSDAGHDNENDII